MQISEIDFETVKSGGSLLKKPSPRPIRKLIFSTKVGLKSRHFMSYPRMYTVYINKCLI